MQNIIRKSLYFIFIIFSFIAVYPNLYLLRFVNLNYKLVFRITVMIILGIIYLIDIYKTKRIDILAILCLVFAIYQVIIALVKQGDLTVVIYSNLVIGISCLIISDVFIRREKKIFICAGFTYFFVLILINTISGFNLTNNDIARGWSFFNKNNGFKYILALYFFLEMLKIKTNKKYIILSILIYVQTLWFAIYSHAMACLLCLIILIPYTVLLLNKDIKIINLKVYIIVSLVLFCIFALPGTHNPIMGCVSVLLGKNNDASGRFQLYDSIKRMIMEGDIIFGNGYLSIIEYTNRLSIDTNPHPHCTYFDVFYRYGFIGILFIIFIAIICVNIIKRCKNIRLKNLAQITLFLMLFWSIADLLNFFSWMLYIGFATYFIGKFELSLLDKKIVFISNE